MLTSSDNYGQVVSFKCFFISNVDKVKFTFLIVKTNSNGLKGSGMNNHMMVA